jgi:DNA (cytosine-5)-methyltransferase 1
MANERLTVADFFCGAGGFSEGFRQKGFKVAFALDNWAPAIETHKLNHPDCHHEQKNILDLDTPEKIDALVPDTEIIIGSPPCVAFSGSNKAGKAEKGSGIQLIESYLRIIAWKKKKGALKYWLLENVPNSGKYIKDEYTWEELGLPGRGQKLIIKQRNVLNAADYGAPQGRKRFVCGDYPLPKKTHENAPLKTIAVLKSLTNPLGKHNGGKIIDPVYGFNIDSSRLTDHFYNSRVAEFEWTRAKSLKENHGFMGKMSFPEDLDRPSRTVMATMSASTRESMLFDAFDEQGKHVGYRLPTIREIATLMSFPITYQFEAGGLSSKYRLVGNAVCAKMSAALAEAISKEEGIETPEQFPPLPDVMPSFNLNGMVREPRKQREKPFHSVFEHHIPYLKIKGIRVQLSNADSDFKTDEITWACKVRYGQPKNHKSTILPLHIWEKILIADEKSKLISENRFSSFKEDVTAAFKNRLPGSKEFQLMYCRSEDKPSSPEGVINHIKQLVDAHYPEKLFSDVEIFNTTVIERKKIPIRIAAAAYACSYVARIIN